MAILRPLLAENAAQPRVAMVIGTVKSDIPRHRTKILVSMMMEVPGCEVVDLGINNFVRGLPRSDVDKPEGRISLHVRPATTT